MTSIIATDALASVNLHDYDRYLVMFSGGKDSLACLLWLLDQRVSPDKIELHHHLVDGREGSTLMDWPCTESYCQAVADHFGIPLRFSWKAGGFEAEMTRENQRTSPIYFYDGNGQLQLKGGTRGKLGTRMKFPQKTADLSRRWCSAYLKIDVGARLITNDDRFLFGDTLVITGERAEESAARARYAYLEPHRTDNRNSKTRRRYVDHMRPVLHWSESDIWGRIESHGINPHPAYHLGFGRCSCAFCIFASKDQWATLRVIDPHRFNVIADWEDKFRHTIDAKKSVRELADLGTPYPCSAEEINVALDEQYSQPITLDDWQLPLGAYGEANGPI